MTSLTDSDVETAKRTAKTFLKTYYATYDSAKRAEDLPKYYREASQLIYNGSALTGPAAIKGLIERLPVTKHEVRTYVCHPVPSISPQTILITVSGLVTHGTGSGIAVGSADTAGKAGPATRSTDVQPRVFSQTLVLVKEEERYYVSTDHFRFVG